MLSKLGKHMLGQLAEGTEENKCRNGIYLLLIVLLLANIVGLVYFNFVTYQVFFNSDSAGKNLLAEEVFKSGSLFPRNWTYVHDDIQVVFGHLFIIPWLSFVRNNFNLHAVSGVISAAILLSALWWFTGVLTFSKFHRLFTLCLFSSGTSPYWVENIYGQASYGLVGCLIFLQLGALFKVIEKLPDTASRTYKIYLLFFCLISFLVFLSNPARAFLTFTLPIISGIVLVFVSESQINIEKACSVVKMVWPALVFVIASITLGWLCHHWLLTDLTSIASGSKGRFLSLDALGNNLGAILKSLLLLFGANPAAGTSSASPTGVDHFSRLLILSAVVWLALAFLKRRFATERSREVRFLAGFFLGSFLPVMYLFIFTNIFEALESSRYLVPAFIVGLLFLVAYINDSYRNHGYQFGTALIFIPLLVISLSGYRDFVQPLVKIDENGKLAVLQPTSPQIRLSRYLQSKGLHYGYATYWYANVITVLSGGDVIVRPISFENKLPRPRYHLSSRSWYSPASHSGTTFLIVDSDESKVFNLNALIVTMGSPVVTYSFESYRIYVFDSNIAATVFGWSTTFDEPQTLRYSEATSHNVGRFVNQDQHGWMESSKGESGALIYGPYQALDSGKYTASFDLAGCGGQPDADVGVLDVTTNNGKKVAGLAQIRLSDNKWHDVSVDFDVKRKDGAFEFRVLSNGNECLRARSVTIRKRTSN